MAYLRTEFVSCQLHPLYTSLARNRRLPIVHIHAPRKILYNVPMQSKPLTPRVLELTTTQNSKLKTQNSKLRAAVVLDGRLASAEIRRRCAEEVQALLARTGGKRPAPPL